jgi:flagellar biogenesis protein FliO
MTNPTLSGEHAVAQQQPLSSRTSVQLGAVAGVVLVLLGAVAAHVQVRSDVETLKTALAAEAQDRKKADDKHDQTDVDLAKAQAAQNLEVSGMKTDIGYIKEGVRRIENALTRGR